MQKGDNSVCSKQVWHLHIASLTDSVKQNSIVLLSYSAAHDQVSYFLIVSILSDSLSLKMCVNWQP